MTATLTATIAMRTWEEKAYDEPAHGGKLTRVSAGFTYTDGIDGTGGSQMLLAYPSEDYCGTVALERVTGRIGDRSGTFVLSGVGSFADNAVRSEVTVVPGSGTGDLAGLSGHGRVYWPHGESGTLTLEYTLG